jgi:hypothetical protein
MKNYNYPSLILALLLGFFAHTAHAQLSGTYTIDATGSGGKNYKTFNAAVDSLTTRGVSGPVVFNVADGVYKEQVRIPFISGASATNTITFQSKSGDSSKAVLTWPSSSGPLNNYTLGLDSCRWLVFNKLTLARLGNDSFGTVINFLDSVGQCTFTQNMIVGLSDHIKAGLNKGVRQSLVVADFFGTDSDIVFRNNYFKYGSSGIYWNDQSSASLPLNVAGNHFDSCGAGIYIYIGYGEQIIISGNLITNCGTAIGFGLTKNYKVINNKVINCDYGMSFNAISQSDTCLVANNFLVCKWLIFSITAF